MVSSVVWSNFQSVRHRDNKRRREKTCAIKINKFPFHIYTFAICSTFNTWTVPLVFFFSLCSSCFLNERVSFVIQWLSASQSHAHTLILNCFIFSFPYFIFIFVFNPSNTLQFLFCRFVCRLCVTKCRNLLLSHEK